jgi:serine/threonine-protein kinase
MALATGSALAYRAVHVVRHELPTLTNIAASDADAQIEAKHWKVVHEDGRADGVPAGYVMSQDPPPGVQLAEGKEVRLVVSLGNTLTTVPAAELPGKTLEEATALLQAAALGVGTVTEQADETVAKGVVIAVDPTTPAQLPKDDTVNLTVSSGPAPRQVPAIAQGSTYDQAVAALEAVQLKASKVEVFNDTVPAGKVIATDPAAGTEVARDATVTVQVSKGPQLVPDVSKKSVTDAIDALEAAGYVYGGLVGDPRRTVTATNPPAGTPAPKGTSVTLITR